MLSKTFIDLDELTLLCRNEKAKGFIQEAVQCYRGLAYRQTIVATWIAVVYDIIHKLQELEMTGDVNAKRILTNYERVRRDNDIKGSLDFERTILEVAKKEFELLTEYEYIDLVRLQDDRNRCAHPAMNLNDEIYQPSPELARTHLRNAIEHLLQRPPVQGKAALDRLVNDIDSVYFPLNVDDAIKYFSAGPLARPRSSLVRNFVIVLTKNFLGLELGLHEKISHYTALLAISKLHSAIFYETLEEKLNDIIVGLPDKYVVEALSFVAEIQDTWQLLADDSKNRLKMYVRNMPEQEEIVSLGNALKISDLIPEALLRLEFAGTDCFISLANEFEAFSESIRIMILEKSIEIYKQAGSYAHANSIGKNVIIPFSARFTRDQVESIVRICGENSQVKDSHERKNVLTTLLRTEKFPAAEYEILLERYNINDFDLSQNGRVN